jgi:hypothetical protein
MVRIIDNYHNIQQDLLETFIDRGQLRQLAAPTILPNGRRIPGLKLDHPRQLAVMHSLVRFANIAAGGQFTVDLCAPALDALGCNEAEYSLRLFVTIFRSYASKGWSNGSRAHADTAWSAKAIRFAWPSSNCSRKSTRPSLRDYSPHFAEIAYYRTRNGARSTACISDSAMTRTSCCERLVSALPREPPQRERNSRRDPYNGN